MWADEEKEVSLHQDRNPRQVVEVEFDRIVSYSDITSITNVLDCKQIRDNTWVIEAEGTTDIRPALFSFAVTHNLTVLSMQEQEGTLEDIFRLLTSR